MATKRTREERKKIVSRCLRRLALEVDPEEAKLSALAKAMDLHRVTLSIWIKNGRIPRKSANALRTRFGGKKVNVKLLMGDRND